MEKLVQALTFSIVFSPFFFLMLVFTSYKPSKNKSIKKHIQEEYIQKPLKSIGFLLLIILLMTITLYTML
ncbi:MAG: hypothetical protein GXY98_02900 [Erysipelothrix sp.]|nr:hypothetical protein [Erysipelothrix sp.]